MNVLLSDKRIGMVKDFEVQTRALPSLNRKNKCSLVLHKISLNYRQIDFKSNN